MKAYCSQLDFDIYVNHASISPINDRSAEAMQSLMTRYRKIGASAWVDGRDARDRVRGKLAQLINCRGEDIGLTTNTSSGITAVAMEFPWKRGDRILLFEEEFPANVLPWKTAAAIYDLDILYLKIEDLINHTPRFTEIMNQGVAMLAVSWVQFQSGKTIDLSALSALRERYETAVCVDAIQGLGALCLDLQATPLDFVVAGGHKWLLGPEGCGFYYADPKRFAAQRPIMVGWLSKEDAVSFLFRGAGHLNYDDPYKDRPARIESASLGPLPFVGWEKSLDIILEVGAEKVSERVIALAEQARVGLRELGLKPAEHAQAGIAAAPMEAEPLMSIFRTLQEKGIALAIPDGHLRIAAHFWNEPDQIDRVIAAIRACM